MATLRDKLQSILRYRLGFHMDEVMSGTHEFEPGLGPAGRRPMHFCVRWGPKNLGAWLDVRSAEFMSQPLAGTMTIDGLCESAPCTGTLAMRYVPDGKIRYDIAFRAGETDYRYVGEKVNIRPWNLPVSHTTCFGTLTEAATGRLVSRSVTHFRMHTTPAFLASFRLALAPVE
jgi:hypothetical protein